MVVVFQVLSGLSLVFAFFAIFKKVVQIESERPAPSPSNKSLGMDLVKFWGQRGYRSHEARDIIRAKLHTYNLVDLSDADFQHLWENREQLFPERKESPEPYNKGLGIDLVKFWEQRGYSSSEARNIIRAKLRACVHLVDLSETDFQRLWENREQLFPDRNPTVWQDDSDSPVF